MRQMALLAVSVVLAAVGIAYGLLALAAEVREVSGQLAALSRNVNSIAGDVTSLADDVSAIADSLASDDDTEKGQAQVGAHSGASTQRRSAVVRGSARGMRRVRHTVRDDGNARRDRVRHPSRARQLTCSAAPCRSW